MSSHFHVLALFADFERAFAAIADIRRFKVPGVGIDDITLKSPIEHPEVERVLGERPVHVRQWSFFGAAFGLIGSFVFFAGAQANFLAQHRGGKAVITVATNIVLSYEMLVLFGVLFTLVGFVVGARLMRKKGALYDTAVSVDQIGILIENLNEEERQNLRTLFRTHGALDILEEVIS